MWIKLLTAGVVALLAAAGVTVLALEIRGVVSVHTEGLGGGAESVAERTTRIWFVQDEGELFLEAGHPDNPWVGDLDHMATLRLEGQDLDGEYTFEVRSDAADHERIRALMRGKYGWRDGWIGLIFDSSGSELVALQPAIGEVDV